MKVAELFAEIGFKVTGQDDLKAFEASLQNIAQAARDAVSALKGLASVRMPKPAAAASTTATGKTATTAPAAIGVAAWWRAFQARQNLANSLIMPQPPLLGGGGGGSAGGNTAILQGLKALGMLGLKLFGITTLALALKKLVSTMIDMVRATREAAVGMEKFTGQTGISRATLKSWQLAASKVGVSADEVEGAFKGVLQKQQQIRWTGEGATPFLQLGINALAPPQQVFRQFQERTRNMTQAQAVYWGSLIGFSEDWVYFLRQQKTAFDDLDQRVLSPEQQSSVMQLNAAWQELIINFGLLRDKLVSDVAPALSWVLQKISDFEKVATVAKPMRDLFLKPDTSLLFPAIRGAFGGTTKVENHVQVDVTGSDRPKETARETAREIQRTLSNSYYQRPPPSLFNPGMVSAQ